MAGKMDKEPDRPHSRLNGEPESSGRDLELMARKVADIEDEACRLAKDSFWRRIRPSALVASGVALFFMLQLFLSASFAAVLAVFLPLFLGLGLTVVKTIGLYLAFFALMLVSDRVATPIFG